MADIKNIQDLRQHAVNTLTNLEKNKIDVVQAGVTAKLYENIISSLKTELDYHKMLDQKPIIDFLEGASPKKLLSKAPFMIEDKQKKKDKK